MTAKEDYLKFLIMIRLRNNIDKCMTILKQKKECLKNDPNNYMHNYRYENILAFYKENIRIAKELFNVDLEGNIELINDKICKYWPEIFEYLKREQCDYEWTIKNFEDTKYYEVYKYITSYDLYWGTKSIKKDTDPIYFEFAFLYCYDKRFNEIFEQIINNGFYNPNRRTTNFSNRPFWACFFPNDLNNISEVSKKIILDERCNYRMLNNGTDNISLIMQRLYDNDYNSKETEFVTRFIYKIVKDNNCSILQDYVDDSGSEPGHVLVNPLIYLLFCNEQRITTFDDIASLYKYCISEDGVIRQCKALEYKTDGSNKAIDFYISLIEKDNPENEEGIALLKNNKI